MQVVWLSRWSKGNNCTRTNDKYTNYAAIGQMNQQLSKIRCLRWTKFEIYPHSPLTYSSSPEEGVGGGVFVPPKMRWLDQFLLLIYLHFVSNWMPGTWFTYPYKYAD